MSEVIILIGASTRAAAQSARRAGLVPWCADLFADADLERIATVRKVANEAYPDGLIAALDDAPPAPVIYTGALENRPDLIAKIDRPLWGNPPDVLRSIRSPQRWTQCLQAHGLPCPAVSDKPTSTGRWLLKPRKSAAGFGIARYQRQPFNARTHFLQEWIDGTPVSAVFVGAGNDAILLGVTRQFIGTTWLNATGFHYAGNIGPIAGSDSPWRAIGSALARTFGLRGLFGVDAILKDSVPWPVEINPRYTASVEILERAMQVPLLQGHRDVFVGHTARVPDSGGTRAACPTRHDLCGKAILYARKAFEFPAAGPWLTDAEYADIPHAGTIIGKGQPVLTLFASAPTVSECERMLQEKAQALDRRLWG